MGVTLKQNSNHTIGDHATNNHVINTVEVTTDVFPENLPLVKNFCETQKGTNMKNLMKFIFILNLYIIIKAFREFLESHHVT